MPKLLAYLQLMRFPAVFTALADILLGYLLNLRHELMPFPAELGWLLASSAGLYLAGMVLNDLFDRHVDAQERPERPIPSGRVSVRAAGVLGAVLMACGIGAAAAVGTASLQVAAGLAVLVLVYNSVLKGTLLGPLAMGGCRFLNVMLGASAAPAVWTKPYLPVALGLGIYIAGVTWFARTEARRSSAAHLAAGMGLVNLGLAVLVAFVRYSPGAAERKFVYVMLAVVFLTINRRMLAGLVRPAPERVQAAVGTLLMSYVMLDATLLYFQTAQAVPAVVVAALFVPALLLRRLISVT